MKPKDADVYVDGYFVGIVDDFDGFTERLHVEPGEHTIQFYREGYRLITDKVLFRPRQTYHIKYAMQPLASGEPSEPKPQPAPGTGPGPRPPDRARGYPPERPPRGHPVPAYPPPAERGNPAEPGAERGDLGTFGEATTLNVSLVSDNQL